MQIRIEHDKNSSSKQERDDDMIQANRITMQ